MKKTIVITGGGSGLGQALAFEFAQKNFQVFIIGRRQTVLEQTKQKYPEHINWICGDIADETQRNSIVQQLASIKTIDYLIHNAGIVEPISSLKEMPLEKFSYTMSVNFLGPLFLTQKLLPQLSGARVLNISSLLAHQAMRNVGAYCISKAALYMSKEVFNKELNSENIFFGSVMPGIVDTAMQKNLRESNQLNLADKNYFVDVHEQQQLVKPETCVKFLSYLLLKTSNHDFIQNDWDIYNTAHHHLWLTDGKLFLRL